MATAAADDPPGRGLWIAWGLALAGGLAVLSAVAIAVVDPCLHTEQTLATDPCGGTLRSTLVLGLTGGGTTVAVVGGLIATMLTVRQRSRRRPRP